MLKKSLVALSLLVPLAALSATAQAGSTITDKNYWPNEARRTAPVETGISRGDAYSAFAYDRTGSRLQPVASPNAAGSAWRYQGGPKSR
ncbi:hypothetical protein V1283_003023 [Bradyrhizobium sp. AZCC 2262]